MPLDRWLWAGVAVALVVVVPARHALAVESPQPNHNPLKALPSSPGAHLEKIKALGDNQWLNLGSPAPDPHWGRARGSAWGAKAFMLSPDKRGAFLFGEGVHAFVKPDGRVMDDLWFYDLNAHAWICLYPGTNPKTFNQQVREGQLKLDEFGQLRDDTGQAIPVHTLIHAWGYLGYDTHRDRFAFLAGNGLGRYFLGGEAAMDEGLKTLEEQARDKAQAVFSLWFYDVASGRFERRPARGPRCDPGGFPQLHYLPSRKQFVAVGTNTVAYYDPEKNEWIDAKPKGVQPVGYDCPGCYDSKRERVYRNTGDGDRAASMLAYDIKDNRWLALEPQGRGPAPMNTNGTFYEYDPRLDLVVAIQMKGETPGVFTYDPAANRWSDSLPLPQEPKFHMAANTFYDPVLNVYFCHVSGDSNDNGIVWAYRYRQAEAGSEDGANSDRGVPKK